MELKDDLEIKQLWDGKWEDTELYAEIRKIISLETSAYQIGERLDKLIKNIPNIISSFKDCTNEEEYRMLAKKSDGTLATIQIQDKKTGFQVYSPIGLNSYEYKKFYYETLLYSLITYFLFFKDVEFQILNNDNVKDGTFSITDASLPHLLGLESKFVSSKDSALLEKIIPGYNFLGIIDKILCIIENNEKIIQYEKDNELDVFNYYKSMQKNKEFLMLGRFFNSNEDNVEDKNKIFLITNSNNQLCLYKKSNMNEEMNRNICKLILQRSANSEYFPRSLQAVSTEMIEGFNVFKFLLGNNHNIFLDGENFKLECQQHGIDGYTLYVSNERNVRGYMYSTLFYQNSDKDEVIRSVDLLISNMTSSKGDDVMLILEEIKQEFRKNNVNDIGLRTQLLKKYISESTQEQLKKIDELLEDGNYQKIVDILEEYILNININNLGDDIFNDFYDINTPFYLLYYILALVILFIEEKENAEKQLLKEEIEEMLKIYRNTKEQIKK